MKVLAILLITLFPVSNKVLSQTIQIDSNRLFINSVAFDSKSLIADYIKVLGQPSRVENLANNIYVFDSLGIYIYENYRNNNEILEISFDFKKGHQLDFSPNHKFEGKVHLVNYHYRIKRSTGFYRIKKLCKKNKNQSIDWFYGDTQFNYGGFLLLFEHNFFLGKTQNFTIDFGENR